MYGKKAKGCVLLAIREKEREIQNAQAVFALKNEYETDVLPSLEKNGRQVSHQDIWKYLVPICESIKSCLYK